MLKPYFEDKDTTLYCAPCEDVIPQLPKFDLLCTDPPYGIFKPNTNDGKVFGKRTIYTDDASAPEWDVLPSKATFDALFAICELRIVFGYNYMADLLGPCNGPLVWNKMTGKSTRADGELAWSNVAGAMRIFTHQWCGAFKDSEHGMKAMHPTQKPVQLMTWCLAWAKEAKTVLDPYAGSGSTLVAAKLRGIHGTGIERSEDYCKLIVERLRQGVLAV